MHLDDEMDGVFEGDDPGEWDEPDPGEGDEPDPGEWDEPDHINYLITEDVVSNYSTPWTSTLKTPKINDFISNTHGPNVEITDSPIDTFNHSRIN